MADWENFPSIIPLSEKSGYRITPIQGLPAAMRRDVATLVADIEAERFAVWRKGEIEAAKKLLESPLLLPVWYHLNQFIEPHYWYSLLVTVFLKPHRYPWDSLDQGEPFDQEERAARHALTYARIAEHAHRLLELLQDEAPHDWEPGYLPGVDELTNYTDLERTLLKLVSITTACRWPAIEYALRYEKPDEFPEDWPGFAMDDYQDCRGAETFTVYRASKAKDRQHCIGAEYNGFDFHDDVFQRNPKFYSKYQTNPPYQYETDTEREIFLKKDSALPPKFEPLQFPEFSAGNLRANTPHISYLKQMLKNMDEFSDQLDRPPRVWNRGPRNGVGTGQPLWLNQEHVRAILGALFQSPSGEPWEILDSQINRELRKT